MHYFIDQNQLTSQGLTDCYGVVSTDVNKYNLTSKFQLTANTKAFACQDGMMIIQQSSENTNLVNIILKPKPGLEIPFSSVKYYVYRGISKDSFITGTVIKPKAQVPENSFLKKVWETVERFRLQKDLPNHPDPTPKNLGFDDSLSNTLLVEKIFDNSQTETKPIPVKEGDWIGDFGILSKIGFEVILETDSLNISDFNNQINLGYLRKGNHQIDVTGLTGFEKRAKQKLILSYIDPCAFFGLHYEVGVDISVFAGDNKTLEKKKKNDLYTLLLEKFYTKNRVYLDIRSEKGYPYNFYQNYKNATNKNIKIGNSIITPTEQIYETNSWPIVNIDSPLTTNSDINDAKINLRIDDNLKPLLFFENKAILGPNNNGCFLNETKILNGTAMDWSKDINLFFPNTGTEASKKNVGYYLKLYYFRQEYNASSPNTTLKNQFYFHNAFAPIDLENSADLDSLFPHSFDPNASYTNGLLTNTTPKFGFVGETGVNWDANRVLFYNKAIFKNHKTGKFLSPIESSSTTGFSLEGSFNKTSFLSTRITLNVNFVQEIISTGVYNAVKILDIIKNQDFINAYEDLFCFGVTQSEFSTLKNLTGFTSKHHRYIYLEEVLNSPFNDKDDKVFRKFEVKIHGLDNNGNRLIKGASIPIYVYSKSGLVFASKGFAEYEKVSDVELNYEENFHLVLNYSPNLNQVPNSSFQYLYETIGINLKTIVDSFRTEINLLTSSNFISSIENIIITKGSQLLNTARTKIKDASSPMYNKDGAFYLARLQMRKAFKEQALVADYFISDTKREEYLDLIEKVTRGLHTSNIPNFSTHPNHIPILITGYDPFRAAFPNSPRNASDKDYHLSNPSGNISLALNNLEIINGNIKAIIKSSIFPVRYREFDKEWIENFFEPYINPNHSNYQPVKMIITFSYGGAKYFNIDRFSSRFRDLDNFDNNQKKGGISPYLKKSDKDNLEFIETMLPYDEFINASSGKIFLRQKAIFQFFKNNNPTGEANKIIDPIIYPPKVPFPSVTYSSDPAADKIKAVEGSGGDYLSNEIFYRVAFLRYKHNPTLKTGHIHVGFNLDDVSSNERNQMVTIITNAIKQTLLDM